MNGLALLTLYMTLTINSLLPLQCVSNPNGTFSMQTQPGVPGAQSLRDLDLVGLARVPGYASSPMSTGP